MKKQLLLITLCIVSIGFSQTKTVHVKFINEPIVIDAKLDEASWDEVKPATNFWQYFPVDSIHAKQQSEIKMLYDDKNLYVGIKVNSPGNNYIIPSLRRDFRATGNDNISLLFDTFNDGTNAYIFGTNPYGVLREALISGGGNEMRGFDETWDAKWIGKSKIYDNYYIVEWMIPLSVFKYSEGETKWRFNSYHFDTQSNERDTWVNIPQNQLIFNLAYMGDMIFEKPLKKSKPVISVIPYINTIATKDYELNESSDDFKVGGDAKFTIGNGMNLDITLNPDFSQVEVDQQVTNLTPYEVSLPERRQFFIENSDLFADFGNNRDANPFFSRRIGIAYDLEENSIKNDIIGGIRLSGKLNNNLRLGVLNMQTAEDIKNEIPTNNNAVVAIQQKMFSRSNLSFVFVNRQATKEYTFLSNEDKFNRVFGVDYKLASADNSWIGKYYLHKSFSPNVNSKDLSAGATTEFNNKYFNIRIGGLYVGANFHSDLGYVKRTDVLKIDPDFQRIFIPKKGRIQKHSFTFSPIFLWKPDLNFENSDYAIISNWHAFFNNNSEFEISIFNRFTRLYEDFDPTGTDGAIPLPSNQNYYYTSLEAQYKSDMREIFSYSLKPSIGKFFNGEKYSIEAQLRWRLQPFFFTSIQVNYDNIKLPNPYPSASIWLVGPRADFTFNKHLFWTTFIQYSTQQENFSVNTRLQWRFAPLSDLFVVYNDNYFANDIFAPRMRSFNLKLTYWLTI